MFSEYRLRTTRREEFIDLSPVLARFLAGAGAGDGLCAIFVPHTTAGVTINENADPDVPRDIIEWLARIAPERAGWRHAEGNSDAHVKTTLTGSSVQVIVRDGRPLLGAWQSVFFCEFDGPRDRKVWLQFLPDR